MIFIENIKHVEYETEVKLQGKEALFFPIPSEIILHEVNKKLVSVFSYFSVRRGLDRKILFSLDYIARWIGKKPNRNQKGVNPKIELCIGELSELGYLSAADSIHNARLNEAEFNLIQVTKKCDEEIFAIVYLDELEKILNYRNDTHDERDTYFGNDIVLLVFAYLRLRIYKRNNKLCPESINLDNKNDHKYDVQMWKENFPEAFDCYFHEIGDTLGLTERSVSKALYVLRNLDLIYFEELPKYKIDDEWRTDHTIFCNTYKREKGALLASGKEYYLTEVKNKKNKIKKYRMKNNRCFS